MTGGRGGYRALEFRTKPLWWGREDKEREGKVRKWEEAWGDNRKTEKGKIKQKENHFLFWCHTRMCFWHVRPKHRHRMTRWRKLFYSVYPALNIKNVKSKVFIATLFGRRNIHSPEITLSKFVFHYLVFYLVVSLPGYFNVAGDVFFGKIHSVPVLFTGQIM